MFQKFQSFEPFQSFQWFQPRTGTFQTFHRYAPFKTFAGKRQFKARLEPEPGRLRFKLIRALAVG